MTTPAHSELAPLPSLGTREALRRILETLGADTGTVHRLREDGLLHLDAYLGEIPDSLLPVIARIPVGKGMAGVAAQRLEPVQTCDLQSESGTVVRPGARATGMRGSLCVPMMNAGHLAGVLGVAVHRERQFSPEETAWLLAAGEELAVAR